MLGPRIPILCYHLIEQPPVDRMRDQNFVTPERFARHVALLAQLGFAGITVRDIVAWQGGRLTLPDRAVAITFDDAYGSIVEHALPVLTQRGWRCTVYAVSACVGKTNVWDPSAPRATILDAPALRTLVDAGHEIGSHSRRHRRITMLNADEAREELEGSRIDLEGMLGTRVETFAFPYGTHDRSALHRLQDASYSAAVTLKRWGNGRRTNPLRLGRMGVGGPLETWQLAAKLAKMLVTPAIG